MIVTWRLGNVSARADMSRSPITRNKTSIITVEQNDAFLALKRDLDCGTPTRGVSFDRQQRYGNIGCSGRKPGTNICSAVSFSPETSIFLLMKSTVLFIFSGEAYP